MIDPWTIKTLKDGIDCRQMVAEDLGQPSGRAASSWVFTCPFHAEKTTGGFHVFKDGYKCFSCGENGDALTWLIGYRKMTFGDAVEWLNGGKPAAGPSPQETARRAAEYAERTARELEEKIAEAQRALEELRKAQTWLKYYETMDNVGRSLWHKRGLPDAFIDLWQLGYCPDFPLWEKDDDGNWVDWWHTPTLSIPVWGIGGEVQNVKHRLLNEPPHGAGKYRSERKGILPSPFFCDPDQAGGPLFLVEGEIKAMVSYIQLDKPGLQVAGLPGVTPDKELFKTLTNFDPVYLLLDPDAYQPRQAGKPAPITTAINEIGRERVRVLYLPAKIDDMINAGEIGRRELAGMMKTAERV